MIPYFRSGVISTSNEAAIPYVLIGSGSTPVVVLPGAGDGPAPVDEAALRLALFYRGRRHSFRLLVLGRREPFPASRDLEKQADDWIFAIERLGWPPSVLECNSAGGPVGQIIAVRRPDLVRGLVLSCTYHRDNEVTRAILEHWIHLARERRWGEFTWSSVEETLRPETVARMRPLRPILGLVGRPRDPERVANVLACLRDFDNRPILPSIARPTLVIGGEDDRVIPAEIQREMASLIPSSRLELYPGYGHGNDQENPDYERQFGEFVRSLGA